MQLAEAEPAVGAGQLLREDHIAAAHRVHQDQAVPELQGGFQGVCQPAVDAGPHDQPVHNGLYAVGLVALQGDLVGEFARLPVDPDAGETLAPEIIENLLVFALLAANDRPQDLNASPLRHGHDPVDDLIDRLLSDLAATLGAMGYPDTGVQKPHVVVDLSDRGHCGARVPAGPFLVYGYRGRQALDVVHIRLVHLPKKLTGIGR